MAPLALAGLAGLAVFHPAQAGPVVCTTTLEAPPADPALQGRPAAPVEVTRCNAVQTVPDLVQRRYYSWTAPYARGVSLTNQITELFGIAMGGGDGTRVMGLGFSDQAIVWDGTAIENTYRVLKDQQSDPMPWRTADVSNGFSGNLGNQQAAPVAWEDPGPTWSAPVRGLW
nr:Occludin/ELL family protein [Cyanobium sp. NIES-981]